MEQRLSHYLVKLLTGCALLLLLDCFASQAWAGCGDHVVTKRDRAGAASVMDDGPEQAPQAPCSGPMCSRHEHTPPSPPAPVYDQDDRGLPPERLTLTPAPLAGILVAPVLYPVPGLACLIFHPPRPRGR